MEMKLIKLLVVFFQRTKFLDLNSTKNAIVNTIDIFSDSKEEILQPPPQFQSFQIPEEYKPIQITSNANPYALSIIQDKLDFFTTPIFEPSNYDGEVEKFIHYSRLISSIVASEDNICGRIGIVNQSFIPNNSPDMVINKKYFRGTIPTKSINININFNEQIELNGLCINKIDTIQPGTLKPSNKYGIILQRDFNIDKTHAKLDAEMITDFFDAAKTCMQKSGMWNDDGNK